MNWRARSGRGPVEHFMEIENQSGACVTVSHQDACLQDVHQFLDFLFSQKL